MNKEIEYYIRQVYGKDIMYIVDLKTRQCISDLTGEKSLIENAKQCLEELGFAFKKVFQS